MPVLDEVVERSKRRSFTPPRVFKLGGSRGARELTTSQSVHTADE
jgi:hypothetical protein